MIRLRARVCICIWLGWAAKSRIVDSSWKMENNNNNNRVKRAMRQRRVELKNKKEMIAPHGLHPYPSSETICVTQLLISLKRSLSLKNGNIADLDLNHQQFW